MLSLPRLMSMRRMMSRDCSKSCHADIFAICNAEAANRSEPNYVCLDKCVGWSESAVRRMLESQGVKRVQGDVKCPHQSGSGPGEEKQSLISSQV